MHTHTLFPLTLTHLRFTCEATTPLHLDVGGFRAGGALRGALGNVMQRAMCICPPDVRARGERLSECYACWILMGEKGGGDEQRAYSLVPPLPLTPALSHRERGYETGERFDFYVTLYGEGFRYLPHFLLSVNEAGCEGVGYRRGTFAVQQVWAVNPLAGQEQCVLAEGERLVHVPSLHVTQADVLTAADTIFSGMCDGRLALNFLTPTRLIDGQHLNKAPDFGVLFSRLLRRVDELSKQHCGGARRDEAERLALHALADRVRLVEDCTRWVEVFSGSQRTGQPSPTSGFVGAAIYRAPADVWRPLLPWLVWGQATQVGKSTVKGNGVFSITIVR